MLSLALICAAAVLTRPSLAEAQVQGNTVVKQASGQLKLHGQTFRFAGSNNYYLMYKSPFMVDDVLDAAAAQGFTVMRTRGSVDINHQDGSNSIAGKADGVVYFQYWNGTGPAYNDGPDGLEHLDYVIYRAGQLGLKLIVTLTNNWKDFGGMDQYVQWLGGRYHDQFYTDPTIRTWYKAWIQHVLTRVNSITGVAYANDPSIMAWELANEPRCGGSGTYPTSSSCTTDTLTSWADDVSHFIKQNDPQHLVAVGDEGFYCTPGSSDWTQNCSQGVDTLALANLSQIDIASYHLYPDAWGKDVAWGTAWIQSHIANAAAIHKPAVLGEYGLLDKTTRNPNYKTWTDTVLNAGGAGALYWILSGHQDDGTLYPDFDGFTVYCPSPVCTTESHFAAMMTAGQSLTFPPVADDDAATTPFATPVTLNVAANDIAYGGATIVAGSVDLDPATPGQQTTLSTAAGTFVARADGTVVFTPAIGFSGTSVASYVDSDTVGRLSTTATIAVTVKPNPNAAIVIASFENGTDGWRAANSLGSVKQESTFATQGSFGLEVDANPGNDWFGSDFTALDVSAKTHIKADIQTLASGTSLNVAIQIGPNFNWCQGTAWGWANPGTITTVDLDVSDLTKLQCFGSGGDLTQLHAVWVFFGSGTYNIDNVRAE
jgi:mannan endo-1,4-beta-mannosidase